jgi:hypothetical protein
MEVLISLLLEESEAILLGKIGVGIAEQST